MKNKDDIITCIEDELAIRGSLEPMDFDEYSHSMGWTEALEWVLGKADMDRILLTKGERNACIKQAQERLKKDCGFGINPIEKDSQNGSMDIPRKRQKSTGTISINGYEEIPYSS